MINNFFINNDLKFLIPEIFIVITILFLLMFASIYSNKNIYKYTKLLKPILNLNIIILLYYILLLLNSIDYNNIISSYLLVNNNLNLIIKLLLSIILIFLLLGSYNYLISYNIFLFEIYIIIMISFVGMIVLVMSYDLIIMYLAIELQSLCFYILTAINKNYNRSIEAGLKYFILGSFSSSLLILGIAIIYGITGMTNFKDLSDLLTLSLDSIVLDYYFFLGIILINIGFYFKLAIVPFHI
jgi:NADH:ubiquinone oxidoreductase subunit 2 (subunit N)